MSGDILAFTGHRPEKLGGYDKASEARLHRFAREWLFEHTTPGDKCIVGMAIGWDQAVAAGCMANKIPFIAAIPFVGFSDGWSPGAQSQYLDILAEAEEVVDVSLPGYAAWKMQRRNEWMVDRCSELIALWDGSNSGTANCVRYAKKTNKTTVNIWHKWKEFL